MIHKPLPGSSMSDPRNVAHAKKVTQEKKHHTTVATLEDAPVVQPGKKRAAAKHNSGSVAVAAPADTAAAKSAGPGASPTPQPPAALEASLVVLDKLKELEFHSRAHLERLAELTLTVEDELKQKAIVGPIGEVYSAQSSVQTALTAVIEAYKAECDRIRGNSG